MTTLFPLHSMIDGASIIRRRPILLLPFMILVGLLASCMPAADDAGDSSSASSVTAAAEKEIIVYFASDVLNPGAEDCAAVFPVSRMAPSAQFEPLAAMRILFAGPTETEIAEGYSSFFSSETADAVHSVRIENGTAYVNLVDIRSVIPNAGSSCGSASFLGQIESTLGQFPEISRVILAIDGDPASLYEWLQIGCPPESDQCDPVPFLLEESSV